MKEEKSGALNGTGKFSLSRREFLQTVGGRIFIFFTCGSLDAQERRPRGFQELPTDFNSFLRIKEDGRVRTSPFTWRALPLSGKGLAEPTGPPYRTGTS